MPDSHVHLLKTFSDVDQGQGREKNVTKIMALYIIHLLIHRLNTLTLNAF